MDISGTNPMLYAFFDEAGALRREANDVLVIPHAGRCTTTTLFSSYAGPISEYSPKVPVEVGNELFCYMFDGEPVAKDGFIDLSDTAPGFGLRLKPVDANFKLTR